MKKIPRLVVALLLAAPVAVPALAAVSTAEPAARRSAHVQRASTHHRHAPMHRKAAPQGSPHAAKHRREPHAAHRQATRVAQAPQGALGSPAHRSHP